MIKETVKEFLRSENREYTNWEVFRSTSIQKDFHTDHVEYVDPEREDVMGMLVINDMLMDQEDYDRTILANTSEHADFTEEYGDKNAKVLVLLVDEPEEEEEEVE